MQNLRHFQYLMQYFRQFSIIITILLWFCNTYCNTFKILQYFESIAILLVILSYFVILFAILQSFAIFTMLLWSFGTYYTISSFDHKQLSKNSLSHKKSRSCRFSMYNIPEFIILIQKLVFRPNLISSTHSNCSTSQKILLPLVKKTSYR